MAAQLDNFDRNFDRHLSGDTGKSSAELSSSEMQKLASLGYIGLQKSSGATAPVAGTDPKDKIATPNKGLEAASVPNHVKPDPAIPRAIPPLQPTLPTEPNLQL